MNQVSWRAFQRAWERLLNLSDESLAAFPASNKDK